MQPILTALVAGALTSAPSHHPDYFPLQPGNQWVYRQIGQIDLPPLVVAVSGVEFFNEKSWSRVTGLPSGDVLLRLEEDGRLLAYDQEAGTEHQWLVFGADECEPFDTAMDPCTGTASIASRAAEIRIPIGEFNDALQILYVPDICADAGLAVDHYLPDVGLIRREAITIAGRRVWELVYARLGGGTYVTEPAVSFTLALSQEFQPVGPMTLRARMTLRNGRVEPILLWFPSGQRFDVAVRNAVGETVYTWSADKLFAAVVAEEELGEGERNYLVDVPLDLPPGTYVVEAWLTTRPRQFAATASFVVPYPHESHGMGPVGESCPRCRPGVSMPGSPPYPARNRGSDGQCGIHPVHRHRTPIRSRLPIQ